MPAIEAHSMAKSSKGSILGISTEPSEIKRLEIALYFTLYCTIYFRVWSAQKYQPRTYPPPLPKFLPHLTNAGASFQNPKSEFRVSVSVTM